MARHIWAHNWHAVFGAALLLACFFALAAQVQAQSSSTSGATPLSSPAVADESSAGAASNPLSVLEALTKSIGGGTGVVEFLDPDTAFKLRAEVEDTDTIVAHWQIADGYYLYRKRFRFTLADGSNVVLGSPALPDGKMKTDEYFGEMEVYYHNVLARLPVERSANGATTIALDVVYQGCADAGLCYPPITKRVDLMLPASHETGPSTGGSDLAQPNVELPQQDRIARSLASGSTWLVLLSFFGFGLLLTFTPCVFPMIPILSSIIVGQGDNITTRKAFVLSLIYVLAMAATYTTAGVVAGLFGANLQAAFQNPWVRFRFSIETAIATAR